MFLRRRTGVFAALTVMLALVLAAPASAQMESQTAQDGDWTSVFVIPADPDMVPDGGEPGASGTFTLYLNSNTETVYYEIELTGVTPPYDSPALTATHIHEGDPGETGPPRVVFDDPQPQDDGTLRSSGFVEGPFVTGAEDDDGNDQGAGFSLSQIEANPGGFYVDVHTEDFPTGAARGQFGDPLPTDLPETGVGVTADGGLATLAPLAAAAAAALALAGVYGVRRSTIRA